MSTSGTYTLTCTRDDLIVGALQNIGKLDPYEVPSPVDIRDCASKLNKIVKQRMGKSDGGPGLKVWTRRRGHLFLSGATGQYSIGPTAVGWTENYVSAATTTGVSAGLTSITVDSATGFAVGYNIGFETNGGTIQWTTIASVSGTAIGLSAATSDQVNLGAAVYVYSVAAQQPLKIEAAVLRDSELNDVPVRILQQADYDYLPQKANPQNSSDPTAVYYEFQLGNSLLFTDCGSAEDVSKHLVLTYLEPIQGFDNALDDSEYPAEYQLALEWLLAEQIAPMYFKVWSPNMERLKNEAVAIAFRKDPETQTLFFQPGED